MQGAGAAIWQINLYYIIFSTYLYSPYVAYSYGELLWWAAHFNYFHLSLSLLHCL